MSLAEAVEAEALPRRFRPYPVYKDSGIELLGKIPHPWVVMPLRRTASIRYGLGEPPKLLTDGLPFIRATDVSNGQILADQMQFVDPADVPWNRDPELRSGDIIVVRSGANTGDSAIVPSEFEGAIAGYDMVARAIRGAVPAFLAWTLLSSYVREAQIELERSRAAQPHLNAEELGAVVIVLPSEGEQRAIAAFLDLETARIDALIAKKETLIALLQEKRAALIAHAVTKGLDPTVPMKESGIEWLGEIPAHWDTKPLKWLFTNLDKRRVPLSSEERGSMPKEYPYYGASGIIDHVESYLFDEPLILVAEDGANLYSRSSPLAFIAEGKYWVNNHAHILRPNDGMVGYWAHVLGCIVFDPWISGSAQPKLTGERLGSIPMPVPPVGERGEILAFADRHARQIQHATAKASAALDRLNELRSALISAAVTGKIDVREEIA
jgi:type I restriction enzyme, S subunit